MSDIYSRRIQDKPPVSASRWMKWWMSSTLQTGSRSCAFCILAWFQAGRFLHRCHPRDARIHQPSSSILNTQSHPTEWTVGVPRNHHSASAYARYRITQSASVHAIRGQGVDLGCTTSVISVHSCAHSQHQMALALQPGQASARQDCRWTTFPSTNPV